MRLFSLLLLAALLPGRCLAADAAPDPDPLTAVLKRFVAPVPLSKTPEEGRLSQSESDLSMLARGLEAFRHPSHYDRVRAILVPNMAEKTRPFFATRESALNALYRTLALIDYTRASNSGENPCEAAARRDSLLRDPDGLFAGKDGTLSPWLASILGIEQAGEAKAALEKASSTTGSREKLRARVLALSNELEAATGVERQGKLCERAADYEALAALPAGQTGVSLAGLVSDSRNEAVLLLRAGGKIGAAVAVKTPSGTRLLTAAALVKEGDEVALFAADGSSAAARAERVDAAAGLALLTSKAAPSVTALDESAAPEADAIAEAIGHPRAGGAWSRTRGLIGQANKDSFQTDALFDAGSLGGPVFSADGSWLGVAVAPPGAAVTAAAARRWLDGKEISPKLEPGDNGTGSFLTAARLDALDAFAAGGAPPLPAAQELTEASLPDVPPASGHCVMYCESAGPPPPSYASPAPSAPAYYPPPNLNAIFTRALAEQGANMLADVMAKGVTNMLNSLFKPRPPRPRPEPIVQRVPESQRYVEVPQVAPEQPEPPKKKQRRPIGMTLKYDPPQPIEGQDFTIVATLKFSDGAGAMEDIPVHLDLAPSGMLDKADQDQKTDSTGVARFRVVVKEDQIAQARDRAAEANLQLASNDEKAAQPGSAVDTESTIASGQTEAAAALTPAVAATTARTGLEGAEKAVIRLKLSANVRGAGAAIGIGGGLVIPIAARGPGRKPKVEVGQGGSSKNEDGNKVRMHIQLNGQSGAGTHLFDRVDENVTSAEAQQMLTDLKNDALNNLSKVELDGFWFAVERASEFLDVPRIGGGNTSFKFGPKKSHRLDIEIQGRYPYEK
jgi:hypothetical protein